MTGYLGCFQFAYDSENEKKKESNCLLAHKVEKILTKLTIIMFFTLFLVLLNCLA